MVLDLPKRIRNFQICSFILLFLLILIFIALFINIALFIQKNLKFSLSFKQNQKLA
tara:strand:+ start:406 stop:573 length:168 start_codon:yes stop_codon:yes gene_type:complete